MDNKNRGGGRRIIMTSWAARMHQHAADFGTAVTACYPAHPYPLRIEKVKFGVPLEEVFKNDIPGPLLVLILKLNKEAPYKKDVFRAPGHHGNMKKLIHFLQHGRLVNIDNFSVYTIASVLKKFLRKLPDGIFGREGEQKLFEMIEMTSVEEQRDHIHSLIASLPVRTQRLIVLLFGTFRVISNNSERSQTGMTSEALGVSVAPSFFQSCVSDGKTAKMEDVLKFKAEIDVATKIMKFLIDNFGVSNLFGRENYEYYARITGRILKVEEDWIFSFRYPPDGIVTRLMSLEAEKTWLQYESERWGLKFNLAAMSHQEECHSTPALLQTSESLEGNDCEPCSSLTIIPENNLLESYTRLSISLEDNGLFKDTIEHTSKGSKHMTLDELRAVNHYAESTKSLSFLPQVHERQAARMKTRSEWFLSPTPSTANQSAFSNVDQDSSYYVLREESTSANRAGPGSLFSSSAESLKQLVRRSSSKEKDRRLVRRSSSKKNKENGSSGGGASGGSKAKTTSPSQTNHNSTVSQFLPSETSVNSISSNAVVSSPSVANNSSVLAIESTIYSTTSEADSTAGDEDTLEPFVPSHEIADGSSKHNSSGSNAADIQCDDCTRTDVQTFHVTLCYKPRI